MKCFATIRWFAWILVLFLAIPARAQFLDSSAGLGAGMVRLFGDVKAFTAQTDLRVYGTNRQEVLRAPMTFELLDGHVRMDFDMTTMQGKLVQPGVTTIMNQAGLNQVASIMRLDKRRVHVMFNRAQSYMDVPMSPEEVAAAEANVQVQRTPLGKEKIANRPCSKTKVLVRNAKGATLLEATTWNVDDMKGFPIQVMIQAKEGTTLLRFSQVQFARPAASRFEPPRNFKKYEDQDALLVAAMQKRLPAVTSTAPAPAKAPSSQTGSAATAAANPGSVPQKSTVTRTPSQKPAAPANTRTNVTRASPRQAPSPKPAR